MRYLFIAIKCRHSHEIPLQSAFIVVALFIFLNAASPFETEPFQQSQSIASYSPTMPRRVSRCFMTMCIFLSFAILVSILDRFFNRLSHQSYIMADKSTNDAGVSSLESADFLQAGSQGISVRDISNGNFTKLLNQHFHQSKQVENTTSYGNNRLHNSEDNTAGTLIRNSSQQSFDIFKHNWCRMQRARLDWKEVLGPCLNSTVWEEPSKARLGVNQITDPSKSFISHWDIRNAGEFSRLVIQTVLTSNASKTVGGDSWRIHIYGPSALAPSVLDHDNGTYEVLFLIIEDGEYEAKIFLDYSLCHGFKDPPPYWFRKGNSQGKNQPDGVLKGDRPYLIAPFRDGEKVTFRIPPSDNNLQYIDALVKEVSSNSTKLQKYTCENSCGSLLWDGFGRWVNGQWKPYIKENKQKDKRNKEGIFFTFGDSISNAFYSSLTSGPYRGLCNTAFIACRPVYHWVYDMAGYWGDGVTSPREPLPDDMDYNHERVINDVKKTLFHPEMTEKSVLLLNMGIHFAAAVNFTNYKRVIDELISLVNDAKNKPNKDFSNTTNTFKGRFIWKTSTALNRERFPNPHKDVRRFLTYPRVKLYNAYATSAMCRAGIDVIDVHPISDSYPAGTVSGTDPVHYADHVFRDVEALLYEMFSL